jgi:hypothetical protein
MMMSLPSLRSRRARRSGAIECLIMGLESRGACYVFLYAKSGLLHLHRVTYGVLYMK